MGRHVLVWDAPNVDMSVANIINGKPTAKERPDLAVLGEWLVNRANSAAHGNGGEIDVEACVFVNVAPHVAGPLRGWVLWLLEEGFRVFARPKLDDSDVDDDMVDHLFSRHEEGGLSHVYVGSNDAKCFHEPLRELQRDGVRVTVLGFSEFAGSMAGEDDFEFVDLEEIHDLFEVPLPRINLETLPSEGRWFEPTGMLGS